MAYKTVQATGSGDGLSVVSITHDRPADSHLAIGCSVQVAYPGFKFFQIIGLPDKGNGQVGSGK